MRPAPVAKRMQRRASPTNRRSPAPQNSAAPPLCSPPLGVRLPCRYCRADHFAYSNFTARGIRTMYAIVHSAHPAPCHPADLQSQQVNTHRDFAGDRLTTRQFDAHGGGAYRNSFGTTAGAQAHVIRCCPINCGSTTSTSAAPLVTRDEPRSDNQRPRSWNTQSELGLPQHAAQGSHRTL